MTAHEFPTGQMHGATRFTLANWRTTPASADAFRHVDTLIKVAPIARGAVAQPLPLREKPEIAGLTFTPSQGGEATSVAAMLEGSHTDGFLVMHRGAVVFEHYRESVSATDRHIVFSVSKSITGMLAGIVAGHGLLDPEAPVLRYLPEVAGSAYGDCTVRHVLDMTVSIVFHEDYLDPAGDVARYRLAMGWNPPNPAMQAPGLHAFISRLPKGQLAHGEAFHYVSPNSDLLGWILERSTGQSLPALMSTLLWQPLGAEQDAYVTVDHAGASRTAGGICVTLRDLARFGEMMRCDGAVDGKRVVPADWIRHTITGGSREAWLRGDLAFLFPKGAYSNQWYSSGEPSGSFAAIGIHGQWIHVDPLAETVIVKQSYQPLPVDDGTDRLMLDGFAAIAASLSEDRR